MTHPVPAPSPTDLLSGLIAFRRPGWTLPQPSFTDPAIHRADLDRIWRTGWLSACHSCELRGPGDHQLVEVDTDPVIVVREDVVEGRDHELAKLMPFWQLTSDQDRVICERQQRGINSSADESGPCSISKQYDVERVRPVVLGDDTVRRLTRDLAMPKPTFHAPAERAGDPVASLPKKLGIRPGPIVVSSNLSTTCAASARTASPRRAGTGTKPAAKRRTSTRPTTACDGDDRLLPRSVREGRPEPQGSGALSGSKI